MASTQDSTLVVIGSGPGIGSSTAAEFAQKGFDKVVLVSRNADRLKEDCLAVEKAAQDAQRNVSVKSWAVDITDVSAYEKVLGEISNYGTLECLLFNAARVQTSDIMKEPLEEMELDFKITNSALLTTARWAIPKLQKLAKANPSASPSLFVTNSLLYKEPSPQHFSLSATKTAQRSLIQSLRGAYQKDGIHVAAISVGGVVSPEAKALTPRKIAGKIWELYTQGKTEWQWDMELLEE